MGRARKKKQRVRTCANAGMGFACMRIEMRMSVFDNSDGNMLVRVSRAFLRAFVKVAK